MAKSYVVREGQEYVPPEEKIIDIYTDEVINSVRLVDFLSQKSDLENEISVLTARKTKVENIIAAIEALLGV